MTNKPILGTVSIVLLLAMAGIVPTRASGVTGQPVSRPSQITTNPHYDRNPSFFQANDGTYWLFFTRGRSGGVRGIGGYDPDSDSYDIYYKTARSIPALQKAKENLVPGSNLVDYNTQRDIAALQAGDGTIWVFTSSGYGPSSDARIFYYRYDGAGWSSPIPIEGTSYAGHIDALEHNGEIWVFFDAWEYILQVTYWDGASWSAPAIISEKATIAKAIVDSGTFYVVWSHIDPSTNTWGDYIGLSTSGDGTTWANRGQVASWLGLTNWDPVIIKDRDVFRLFWAPSDSEQFIATSKSSSPKDPTSWSTPVRVTSASYGGNNWWDFWPEPCRKGRELKGSTCMFYTSERSSDGTARIDGNIWMVMATPSTDG